MDTSMITTRTYLDIGMLRSGRERHPNTAFLVPLPQWTSIVPCSNSISEVHATVGQYERILEEG